MSGLPSTPFDDSNAILVSAGALLKSQTCMSFAIWSEEFSPLSWGVPLNAFIFMKETNSDCSSHRGIILNPIVRKVLAAIMAIRDSHVEEQQAGFFAG